MFFFNRTVIRERSIFSTISRARFIRLDRVIVLDIYASGGEAHRRRHGGSPGRSHAPVRASGRGSTCGSNNSRRVEMITQGVEPGDMILTLGAGSVSQLGEKILENLSVLEKLNDA